MEKWAGLDRLRLQGEKVWEMGGLSRQKQKCWTQGKEGASSPVMTTPMGSRGHLKKGGSWG